MWVENFHSPVHWWSRDPGFEAGSLATWENSANAIAITGNVKSGNYAARLGVGGWTRQTVSYDPWSDTGIPPSGLAEVSFGMSTELDATARAYYRDAGNMNGGIRLSYRWRFLDYNTTDVHNTLSQTQSWSFSLTTLTTCNNSNKTWRLCEKDLPKILLNRDEPPFSASNNAVVVRVRFKSANAAGFLRVDETGIWGD